jgi:chromosomal replication initiator protein
MKAWEQFLIQQELELGVETVNKWLRLLKVVHFDACNLYLEAKDSFQVLWFEEHIRTKVLTKLFNNNKKRIQVHLSIADLSTPPKLSKKSKKGAQSAPQPLPFTLNFDAVDPNQTFDTLVLTESLTLPYKLLTQISESNAAFNPIYIYGPGGCGKTHLLMSATHHLRSQGLKVIYTRAETFTDHVVTAIRAGEMRIFRQAYRNSDVLII